MNLEITDRWLSVQEIVHFLEISKETDSHWFYFKKNPTHRIGKQWKFQFSELNSWIISGYTKSKST